VSVDGGRILVTGETKLVSGLISDQVKTTQFNINLAGSGNELGIYSDYVINASNVGSSNRLSAKMIFRYREFSNGDSTDFSIPFNLGETDVAEGSSQTFTIYGEN